jgi:hypothetical protein
LSRADLDRLPFHYEYYVWPNGSATAALESS